MNNDFENTENARQFERFCSSTATAVEIRLNKTQSIPAELIDVNKAGGMALFVELSNVGRDVLLGDFNDSVHVIRPTVTEGEISLEIAILACVPKERNGDEGIRISGRRPEAQAIKQRGQFQGRRVAYRITPPEPVGLTRGEHRCEGIVSNFSPDGGVGIMVNEESIVEVGIREIFDDGWVLFISGVPYRFHIRRVNFHAGQISIGGQSDELVPKLELISHEEITEKEIQDAEDEFLINFLQDQLPRSKEE